MPGDASALAVNLGKRFGRRSGSSAESPLLSDPQFILFALLAWKALLSYFSSLWFCKGGHGSRWSMNPRNYLTYSIGFFDDR